MTAQSLALSLITSLVFLAGVPKGAHAQANDMFPTKAAAEQRAKQLKCSGAFSMGSEWMPCSNFDVYEKAIKNEK
jgi:hypothetical protein